MVCWAPAAMKPAGFGELSTNLGKTGLGPAADPGGAALVLLVFDCAPQAPEINVAPLLRFYHGDFAELFKGIADL
jgi:hypothetical protein